MSKDDICTFCSHSFSDHSGHSETSDIVCIAKKNSDINDLTMCGCGAFKSQNIVAAQLERMAQHYDMVNHPPHYTQHPSGVECIQITEHMNFCIGNAVKYLWRADLKNGIEDLEKAKWYIEREIERRKNDRAKTTSTRETSRPLGD